MAKSTAKSKKPEPVEIKTKTEQATDERKAIEVLDAEYGKGKGYTYSIEGSDAVYTYVEAGASKCRIDGVWYISVFYRGSDGMLRSTIADRWRMRFRRIK